LDSFGSEDRPIDCLLPQPQVFIHDQLLAIACPSHCCGVEFIKVRVEGLAFKDVIIDLFGGMLGPLI
jgi:hypothetical protein